MIWLGKLYIVDVLLSSILFILYTFIMYGIYLYILKFGVDDLLSFIQNVVLTIGFSAPGIGFIMLRGTHRRRIWMASITMISVGGIALVTNSVLN